MNVKSRVKTQKHRIPNFKSIQEEAKFWDTHDFADYWDEFKPVKVRFAKNLSEGLTVRFDDRSLSQLRSEAHERGVGPTTLIRTWIMERLRTNNRHYTNASS